MAPKNGYASASVLTSVGRSVKLLLALANTVSHVTTDRQSATSLGVKPHLGSQTKFMLLSVRFRLFGALTLTRGRVCHLPRFIVSSRCLYLQFYMPAFYIISC
jgi:hypothetical protein